MRALLLAVPFALLVACSGAQGEIGGELAGPTPATEGGVTGDGGTSIIVARNRLWPRLDAWGQQHQAAVAVPGAGGTDGFVTLDIRPLQESAR